MSVERGAEGPGGTALKVTRYGVDERVATITLDRPHRLNAWTGRMHQEYRHLVARAEDDPDVRVIVITGAGSAFCAGADTAALDGHVAKGGYDDGVREALAEPGYGVRAEYDRPFAFHMGLRTPVIASLPGAAAGVGLVLACYADLRYAASGAKLTTAHGKLGLPAEFGLSWLLPRIIGLGRAMDLLLSSRVVEADEAAAMGLVNEVVDPADLAAFTQERAAHLAATVSGDSLAETRRQVYADLHRDIGQSVDDADARMQAMMREPAFAEGVRAFLEKRPPNW